MRSLSKKLEVIEESRNHTMNTMAMSVDKKKSAKELSVDRFNPSSDFLDKDSTKTNRLSVKTQQKTAVFTVLDRSTEDYTSH